MRAWRVSREEILANVLAFVRLVVENYYAVLGERLDKERLLHGRLPDALWERISTFLKRLGGLPCWIDKNLSTTVFGAKQNREFWLQVFRTGRSSSDIRVLAKPIDIIEMMQEATASKTRSA